MMKRVLTCIASIGLVGLMFAVVVFLLPDSEVQTTSTSAHGPWAAIVDSNMPGSADLLNMFDMLEQSAFDDEIEELKFILAILLQDALNDTLTITEGTLTDMFPEPFVSSGCPIFDEVSLDFRELRRELMAPLGRYARDAYFFLHLDSGDYKSALLSEFIDILRAASMVQERSREVEERFVISGHGNPEPGRDFYLVLMHSERYRAVLPMLSEFTGIPLDMIVVQIAPFEFDARSPVVGFFDDENNNIIFTCPDWIEYLRSYPHIDVDDEGRIIRLDESCYFERSSPYCHLERNEGT